MKHGRFKEAPCGCRSDDGNTVRMCIPHQASWRELIGRAATERRLTVKPEPLNKMHPTQDAKRFEREERKRMSRLGVLPPPRAEAVVKNKREPW